MKIDRLAGYEIVKMRGCDAVLGFIERYCDMPGVRVDFPKGETSTYLNGLFTNTGLKGMLDRKEYRRFDMLFSVFAGFIYRTTDCAQEAPVTRAHSS